MNIVQKIKQHTFPISFLSIFCLPLWNLFVINTQSIFQETDRPENTVIVVTGIYLFMRLVVDVLVAHFSSRIGSLAKHSFLVIGCPTCMILGTVLITCAANGWVGGSGLLVLGAVLCGIGGELMLLLWLELFVEICFRIVKYVFIGMIASSALLSPLLFFIPSGYLFVICLALPALCILGYHRAQRSPSTDSKNRQTHWHKPSFRGAASVALGIAGLYFGFHFLQSGFQGPLLETNGGYSIKDLSAVIGRGLAFVAVFFTVGKMKDFHYEAMFKTAGIIGIAAFLTLPLPESGFLLFCILTIVACFLVDYAVSLAVVSIASFSDIAPLSLIGRGRATICIGGVFGVVVGSSLPDILNGESGQEYLTVVAASAVLLIAVSSIWLLREQAINDFLWGRQVTASGTATTSDEPEVTIVCAIVAKRYALTAREEQVLNLLVNGRSAPYISSTLYISSETVRSHVRHIYQKIEVHNRQDLLTIVREQGAIAL